VASYKLERCAGTGCTNFTVASSSIIGLSYNDSGLTGNTVYRYRIIGVNATGDSIPSTAAEQLLYPDSPGTPTFSDITPTTLTVSWTAPTGGAASYKLERCEGSGCSNFIQIYANTSATFADSGLTADAPYYYRVKAVNATGDSAYTSAGTTGTINDPVTRVGGHIRFSGGVRLQ